MRPTMTKYEYMVGVDLGQTTDPTAVAVVEVVSTHPGELEQDQRTKLRFNVRHLERFPLGMLYPDQIARVRSMMQTEPLKNLVTTLVIDQTGVGRPVVDLFRRVGLKPMAVTITSGDSESRAGSDDYRVSKIRLVSRLQALLHSGELLIAKALPEAGTLVTELEDFRANINETTGYTAFGARVGTHDDLVLALAIAIWAGERAHRHGAYSIPFKV